MSRVIKFRAWDGVRMTNTGIMFNNTLSIVVSANNMPLMQSTGLLDRKGVEIYEGDIISDENTTFEVEWYLAKWHFKRISGAYQYPSESARAAFMKVVGNIHQHPHLLEGGKNG